VKLPDTVQLAVHLTNETAEALSAMKTLGARFTLVQPTYGRVTDARERDVDLRAFFATVEGDYRVEGVAPCLSGRASQPTGTTVDAAMLAVDGRIDMPKYAARFVEAGFFSRSLRCDECAHAATCRGMHINWIRAHGYAKLEPVRDALDDVAAVA
jgi:hypothetical protein